MEGVATLLITGTIPEKGLEIISGPVRVEGRTLTIAGREVPYSMGTSAMVGAAATVCEFLEVEAPFWVTAGDIGEGDGTRLVYAYLEDRVATLCPKVLTMHYMLPVMGWMKRVVEAVNRCNPRPLLVADAGSMYAAKSAGLASQFDVFTPDAGEIAFLADPEATHPAYIVHHLFKIDIDINEIPRLIESAYRSKNAPRVLIVKNPVDHIALDGRVVATVSKPNMPELEAIGGTGDTITGIVSALLSAGHDPVSAALIATRANRAAGLLVKPTTATRISEIVVRLKEALEKGLSKWVEEARSISAPLQL